MSESIGKLILRLTLGVLIFVHGIVKLTDGIGFITDTVTGAGLPAFFAYAVYVGEVVAPLLLIALALMGPGQYRINFNQQSGKPP